MVLNLGELRVAVLSPSESVPRTGDPNRRAVVAIASYGSFDTLLTADAESDVTLPLGLPRIELLKVAHHGSADPGLRALLDRVRPKLAVIEVGARNPYGHPDRRTLATLRSRVPEVLRTDLDGEVDVRVGDRGPAVTTER
jgi:competence protein ComEC